MRNPIYIKLHSTIVDLSRITGIDVGNPQSTNFHYNMPGIRMYGNSSAEPVFTFLFDDEEIRNTVLRRIEDILIGKFEFTTITT